MEVDQIEEPSPYTIVRNFENIQKQWEEDWQKECVKFGHPTRPKPDRVTASFFPPLPKPVPEHFQVLISRDTARNKASQTYSTYNAYWPAAYMDPTDFLITPNNKKQSAVNTLSELTTIQKNEKETQTSITYNRHKQTIYHCRTCPVFEFGFDLRDTNKYICSSRQLNSSADEETKTAESTDGRGGSIFLEEETTRMALLLGSISKGNHCLAMSAPCVLAEGNHWLAMSAPCVLAEGNHWLAMSVPCVLAEGNHWLAMSAACVLAEGNHWLAMSAPCVLAEGNHWLAMSVPCVLAEGNHWLAMSAPCVLAEGNHWLAMSVPCVLAEGNHWLAMSAPCVLAVSFIFRTCSHLTSGCGLSWTLEHHSHMHNI